MSFGFGVGDFLAVFELANKVRKGFVGAPKEFKAISDDVRDLTIILQDVEVQSSSLSPTQIQDYHDTFATCRELLQELDTVLGQYLTLAEVGKTGTRQAIKRTWKRLKWEPEDIRDIRSRIAVKIEILRHLNDQVVTTHLVTLVRHHEDAELEATLEWISSTNLVLQQNDLALHCQPGSRKWLFESPIYLDWLKQNDGLLFCPGNAGTGKTYTMAMVVDRLRFTNDIDMLTAYVYCTYRNHTQTTEELLRSLLRVVLEEAAPGDIGEVIQTCMRFRSRRKVLSRHDCLSLLQLQFSKTVKVNLLIDALDEVPIEVRRPFINDLLKLHKSGNVNIFITSRDIPEIQEPFQSLNTYTSLEIRSSDEDIRNFLQDNLLQLPNFVVRSPALQKEVVNAIVNASTGMFLLAELHLKSLAAIISPGSLRAKLADIVTKSTAYDQLYEESVQRISFQGPQAQQVAMRTLLVLTCARNPLSGIELAHALSIDDCSDTLDDEMVPDMADLIAACHGLVVVDDTSEIVRLVHKSAQEYFERTRSRWFPTANATMAKLCLRYLELVGPGNVPDTNSGKHAFLRYAKANWSYHSLEAEKEGADARIISSAVSGAFDLNGERPDEDNMSVVTYLSLRQMTLEVVDVHASIVEACRAGHQALVEQLLTVRNYDPNQRDRSWMSWSAEDIFRVAPIGSPPDYFTGSTMPPDQDDILLTIATAQGDHGMVSMLLARGADPNVVNLKGETPLLIAASKNHIQLVSILLGHRLIKPDLANDKQPSPFLASIQNGSEECFKILLERCSRTATDTDEHGAMWHAAHRGHEKIVSELFKWPEISASWMDKYFCASPIVAAMMGGHEDIALRLLPHTRHHTCSKCSLTLLHYAAAEGFHQLLSHHLKHDKPKVDQCINFQDSNDWPHFSMKCERVPQLDEATPLMIAIHNGYFHVVQELLPDANVNRDFLVRKGSDKDRVRRRALHAAVEVDRLDILKLLLEKEGIEPDPVDDEGKSPFFLAAESGNCAVMKVLIEHGNIRPDRKTTSGISAAEFIIKHHQTPLYLRLLASVMTIEVNKQDLFGSTLLHQACRLLQHVEHKQVNYLSRTLPVNSASLVAEILSLRGVDVNLCDQLGDTPLHVAVQSHQRDIVHLLLEQANTKVSVENHKGETALFIASHHVPITEQLYGTRNTSFEQFLIVKPRYGGKEWVPSFVSEYREYDESIFHMLMLDERARPEHRNTRGESVMFRVAISGTKAMVQRVLDSTTLLSDLDKSFPDGPSLFLRALRENPFDDAIDLLIGHCSPSLLNLVDADGRNAFSYAALRKTSTAIRSLLARNVGGTDSPDLMGRTPLSYAAENWSPDAIRPLLALDDTNINAADHLGRTPLYYSMKADFGSSTFDILMDQEGLDINHIDHTARSPFVYAASHGDRHAISRFLRRPDLTEMRMFADGHTILCDWLKRPNMGRVEEEDFWRSASDATRPLEHAVSGCVHSPVVCVLQQPDFHEAHYLARRKGLVEVFHGYVDINLSSRNEDEKKKLLDHIRSTQYQPLEP